MQLERLLSQSGRGFFGKLRQIVGALRIESVWTKSEILEAYLNLVSFRGEVSGLTAASLGYFGKHPKGLDRDESALLVVLLRSPNSLPQKVAERACRLVQIKSPNENCEVLDQLASTVLSQPYSLPRERERLPILSQQFVISKPGEKSIRTTLDRRVQELAMEALKEQMRFLRTQNVNDGAALVLDRKTGEVIAYAANSGIESSASQIDGIQTKRQAGSTLKPFLYATAFDQNYLRANSLIKDSATDIPIDGGRIYHPANYDHRFRGNVTVAEALGSSLNVPAVKTLAMVGERELIDRLDQLGFKKLQSEDYYGLSLALGTLDVTLWELTNAYRLLSTENEIYKAETRAEIFKILSSAESRRFTFGLDSLLQLPFEAAVKTGTSKDMRDNWCVGWSEDFVVGVWVGNFDGKPMWNVSGMSGAAPIWRNLMMALNPERHGQLSRTTLPSEALPEHTISRIRYPVPDMRIGLDPDIPIRIQKLPIEIENPQSADTIVMNGKILGPARDVLFWPLKTTGWNTVELKTAQGTVLDQVKFEVR